MRPANSAEMIPSNLGPDQEFADAEELYFRFDGSGNVGDAPLAVEMRNPDHSVNRQKYGGQPAHVLLPDHPDQGVVMFFAGGPTQHGLRTVKAIISDKPAIRTLTFGVQHAPLASNYFHCDVFGQIDGARMLTKGAAGTFRELRQRLAETSRIVIASRTT